MVKRNKLCARMTQVSRYFGSCRKISGLTTRAGLYPASCFGIKRFLTEGREEGRREKNQGESGEAANIFFGR